MDENYNKLNRCISSLVGLLVCLGVDNGTFQYHCLSSYTLYEILDNICKGMDLKVALTKLNLLIWQGLELLTNNLDIN